MADQNYEHDSQSGREDESGRPVSAAPVYQFEPELLQPTPRPVRVRSRTKIGRWIWIAFIIGIPTLFGQIGNESQRNFAALKDHGVETEATLISTEPGRRGKGGHPPRGTFRYVARGIEPTITIDLTDEEYASIRPQERRKIRYLPEQPDLARLQSDFADDAAYSQDALWGWSIGLGAGAVLVVLWYFAERNRARRRYLAAEGVAVATDSIEMTKLRSKFGDADYEIAYTFTFDGRTHPGNNVMSLSQLQAFHVGRAAATVLVDPADPTRNELYSSVKRAIEVVAAADSTVPNRSSEPPGR